MEDKPLSFLKLLFTISNELFDLSISNKFSLSYNKLFILVFTIKKDSSPILTSSLFIAFFIFLFLLSSFFSFNSIV